MYPLWNTVVISWHIRWPLSFLKIAFKNGVDLYPKGEVKSLRFQGSEQRLNIWLAIPQWRLSMTGPVTIWQEKIGGSRKNCLVNSQPMSWHSWCAKMSNKTLWFDSIFCMYIDVIFPNSFIFPHANLYRIIYTIYIYMYMGNSKEIHLYQIP